MNDKSSSNLAASAPHHGLTAEAISHRAYELWEQEGRPESRDLHHWLRAEQELRAEMSQSSDQSRTSEARTQNTDTQFLQVARPATPSGRDTKNTGKRGTTAPFPGDKNTARTNPPGAVRGSGRV